MQVYIDGDAEKEIPPVESFQTVGEYIEQLQEDLAQVNRVVYRAEVDGSEVDDETQKLACSEVDRLEVEVRTMDKMAIDSIGQLGEYCQGFLAKLPSILKEWDEKSAGKKEKYRQQVLEAFDIVENVLSAVEVVLSLSSDEMDRLSERVNTLRGKLEEADEDELNALLREDCQQFIEELLEHLQDLVGDLQERKRETQSDVEEARQLMDDMLTNIPPLIEQLQSGGASEQEGIEKIEAQVKDLTRVLETLENLDEQGMIKKNLTPAEQEELVDFNQQLNEGLTELGEALKERDIIMICDILEYEVLPYLEKIKSHFPGDNR
jgi:DNA repair exonuclease SbcCD ATPase subunit